MIKDIKAYTITFSSDVSFVDGIRVFFSDFELSVSGFI